MASARSSQSSLFRTPNDFNRAASHLYDLLYGGVPGPSGLSSTLRRSGAIKAAEIAQSPLLQLLLGGVPQGGPSGAMTVFHGTPHEFAPTPRNPLGEFDLGKIGTGEGAQAYGHGIYVAENPGVAKSYRQTVMEGHMSPQVRAKQIVGYHAPDEVARGAADAVVAWRKRGSLEDVLTGEIGDKERAYFNKNPRSRGYLAAYDAMKRGEVPKYETEHGGKLYKVDLPDEHIARMLDWDAGLHQQPEAVRSALRSLVSDPSSPLTSNFASQIGGLLENPAPWNTGESVVRLFGHEQPALADALRPRGVPGLRYFDQGSRAAGQGTRNYVVWDPSILRILGAE